MAPIASNSSSDGQGEKCSSDPVQIPGHEKQQYSGPYSHLPPNQASILKCQIETPERNYSFWHIYRYASAFDLLIIFTATVASCASGAAMPCMTLVFGGMQGLFQDYLVLQTINRDEFQSQINSYALYFVYLGIGSFFATYVSTVGFLHTGENITVNLRQRYLESCLRQNVGFYDKTSAGEVAAKITSDANRIQDGISEKVSLLITAVATLISSFIIGFTMSWKLTLIMSSIFFTLLLGMLIFGKVLAKFTQPLTMAIIKGSTVAHEAFTTVRVAIAFGSQGYLVDQYDKHLKASQKYGFKIKGSVALLMAFIMGLSPLTYSLGFWQGSLFLVRGEMSIETMITTIMVMLIGPFNVGSIGPYLQAYTTALNTASQLMAVVDRKPTVDATENGTGERPDQVRGSIRLENIKHIYPSRPEVVALDNLTIDCDAGKTTAIVGPSGSGKSTIIGLLERFYEPVEGRILVDGRSITALNLHWLRQQIGVVSQEPVLFAGTVYENIRHGLVNSQHEHTDDSTQREMVIKAAKIAHAHDFITTQLANGYDTDVGQRGVLLSGGQKQRIAIARAIVSNPSILLLDEATSALDTKSEAAVQAALDQASIGRTTITIAHRLSTIRNAHKIIVLTDGKVAEQGSHDELLANRGTYYALVTSQELQTQVMEAEPDMAEKKVSELDLPSSKDTSSAAISVESAPATASQEVMALTNTEPSLGDENEYSTWTLIRFVFGLNKQEITVMLAASFFCVIAGLAYPVQAVFFAKQLTTLSRASSPLHDKWEVREESNFWSLMLLMIGLVAFLAFTVQGLTFAHTAEALTRRARRETMLHVLRQDVSFFDSSKHSPSAIGTFLTLETMQLASMSGGNLGNLIASFSTVIGGGALAIAIGWKLALVCLSVVPLLIACTILRFFILKKYENRAARVYVQSAAYAAEHIVAIRTVAALGLETYVARTYKKAMDEQRKESLRSIAASGVLFSASQSFILLSLGLAFWYGSTLMVTREYNIFQFYVCLMAIMFGTQTAGSMLAFTPDVVKARHSAAKLKTFFSRIPTIDTHMPASKARRNSEKVQGRLELRNLRFSYPSRPDQPVLRGIDLSIEPGQHVALVGSSGCGKSTMISLIERFYDPTSGHVLFDNVDISSLPVNEYRSHLAYVSQEPTLFQGTIRENIRISCKDQPSDAALEQACRDANIWDFIASLPSGLDTDVGGAGALLSGGQKQRIAIARALLRQPKVLLLDEATSALDSESERVVQEALARAARGRTTVSIAHRLATIRDADRIVVIDQGKIAESGTHEQLMVRGGLYAELVKLQSLES